MTKLIAAVITSFTFLSVAFADEVTILCTSEGVNDLSFKLDNNDKSIITTDYLGHFNDELNVLHWEEDLIVFTELSQGTFLASFLYTLHRYTGRLTQALLVPTTEKTISSISDFDCNVMLYEQKKF